MNKTREIAGGIVSRSWTEEPIIKDTEMHSPEIAAELNVLAPFEDGYMNAVADELGARRPHCWPRRRSTQTSIAQRSTQSRKPRNESALLDEGRPMPTGHKVGSISSCASGLPKIDTPLSDNYVDYSHVFGPQGGGYYSVGYDELPKLRILFDVARSIPRIREHTFLDNPKMRDDRFFQIHIANLAHDTLDRLLHTVGRDYSADDLGNT